MKNNLKEPSTFSLYTLFSTFSGKNVSLKRKCRNQSEIKLGRKTFGIFELPASQQRIFIKNLQTKAVKSPKLKFRLRAFVSAALRRQPHSNFLRAPIAAWYIPGDLTGLGLERKGLVEIPAAAA